MLQTHQVLISDSGETFACPEEKSLLEGMECLARRGIPVGCRNGGCGVCRVQVIEGEFNVRVMSRAHVSEEEQARGMVLACRTRPCSDLVLKVVGLMRKAVCCQGSHLVVSIPVTRAGMRTFAYPSRGSGPKP